MIGCQLYVITATAQALVTVVVYKRLPFGRGKTTARLSLSRAPPLCFCEDDRRVVLLVVSAALFLGGYICLVVFPVVLLDGSGVFLSVFSLTLFLGFSVRLPPFTHSLFRGIGVSLSPFTTVFLHALDAPATTLIPLTGSALLAGEAVSLGHESKYNEPKQECQESMDIDKNIRYTCKR